MKHNTLGGIFIVAGTAIGASMLALPMLTIKIGTAFSLLLIAALWVISYYSAVITSKINSHYLGSFSIAELCKKANFPLLAKLADLAIITLFYSLLAAYISGMLEMSQGQINNISVIPNQYFGILVISGLILLLSISMEVMDISNRFIFTAKVIAFVIIVICLVPIMNLDNVLHQPPTFNINILCEAIPVFFTSFGFHGSIPVIIKHLNNNEKNVKRAFFYGSTLILCIYCFWILASFAVTPQISSINTKGADIDVLLTSNDVLSTSTKVFSWLAIATSFLGVGASLYDYFREKLKFNKNSFFKTLIIGLVTFIPPIIINVLNKNIFIKALSFAAISLSFLAIILPGIIAIKLSFSKKQAKVKFNLIASAILTTIGIAIVLADLVK